VQDDTLEETGWKLVHGDVFRPPQRTKLLAALIGSGIQILCVAFVVIGESFCVDYFSLVCHVSYILLATSDMDHLDRVSCKYRLLVNIDKVKLMASDGIACRILIQDEQLVHVNTFPYHDNIKTWRVNQNDRR